MQNFIAAAFALVVVPSLAIPPPNFGFPEAPNDTALAVAFKQTSGSYVTVSEGDLFGINIPAVEPIVGVNTTAYQSLSSYNGSYIVLMVDPDASYPQNPTNRFLLHWMQANLTQSTNTTVANLTLTGRQLINTTAAIVPYRYPSPPTNSSAHRYILYAFQQPQNFSIPLQWTGLSGSNRTHFNLTNFINDTKLGTPAAANYFYVSDETAVPADFTAGSDSTYPGGDGDAVTSGDPYKPTAAATSSSSSHSSSSSSAGAAMITGAGGILGAALVGAVALL